MSFPSDLREAVQPALSSLAFNLEANYLASVRDQLEPGTEAKLAGLFRSAADFRLKALTAATPDMALQYLQAAETAVRRIKTVCLAEAVVKEAATAEWLSRAARGALETTVLVTKGLLSAVVQAAAKGAIEGLTNSAPGEVFGGL